ncbi:NADH-quinone oxidoreductase subunit C [Azoarcus olearius]|uniref:NADH-quinone oxidoreductase subunit C n=1 Tax=Azoarcus sp. (strain BH72) TaxID=418699 RepID=NUOC_AZOSB|nr:NADH-quinone oxidoreductase subunit C [Azoarcus olearius]A1K5B0.1 RecName: Full=NADH-quinone oxidoreductase subunit C; AltName: Full=NADH dehydrogenase I subunit C; AltName: Full=NDH-1 subunit C [Azoarcus olearius]ANQ84566.1 NADH dehydrogenase subunit C [Azoarcus olearius]CAL94015.1 respiratory-chain NADH dehydrogenase, chain C probable [Azoarcus olearius]
MSAKLERLSQTLRDVLGDVVESLVVDRGEVTIEVAAGNFLDVARRLRDEAALGFEQLMDISGIDYSAFGNGAWQGKRFASVAHLLSVKNNWRLRLRVFADDDDFPVLGSLVEVWPSANWFEREAFDLYGILYAGHPDLRRILTDYGFVGHPFRKDFPISGYVEMRYDPEQGRVVYQPVTIEPRENTPRIVREENYGDVGHG